MFVVDLLKIDFIRCSELSFGEMLNWTSVELFWYVVRNVGITSRAHN